MRPKKKWGQNFLRNRGAVDKIVTTIDAQPDEVVLEIGPGEGVLTEKLVELPNRIVAIEIDPDLFARLQSRFADRIELRNEDAVDAELPSSTFRAVGNLPYNVGTPILRRVIADPNCRRAVFMLQKEVADRIVAKPGTEAYGFLTLYVQAFATSKIVMTLEPRSFYPPPKVRSAVVMLDPRDPNLVSPRDEVLDLVSASFRMRRKKLVNNLIEWSGGRSRPPSLESPAPEAGAAPLTREEILAAMQRAGIDPEARAETLALQQFDALRTEMRS